MKRFAPGNVTGSFSVMRQKIEKAIEEGLTFKRGEGEEEDEQTKRKRREEAKSPIEKVFEERKEEIIKRERELKARRRLYINDKKEEKK